MEQKPEEGQEPVAAPENEENADGEVADPAMDGEPEENPADADAEEGSQAMAAKPKEEKPKELTEEEIAELIK